MTLQKIRYNHDNPKSTATSVGSTSNTTSNTTPNTASSGNPKVPIGAMAFRPHVTSACTPDSDLYFTLIDSYILDSGASEHVYNDRSRFTTFRQAAEDDVLVAGTEVVKIEGWGDITITMTCEVTPETPTGKRPFQLYNTAYIPSFTANIVSYDRFYDKRIF